jgi:hypothetical protein
MFRLHIAIIMLNIEPKVGKNKTMQWKYYGRDLVLQYSSYVEWYNKWKKYTGYKFFLKFRDLWKL